MKFTIPTKTLQTQLNRLSSIPGAHGAAENTQHVTITADLAGLNLLRFTAEASISVTVGSVIEDEGSVSLHCNLLSALVARVNGEELVVEVIKDIVHLTSNRFKAKLPTAQLETKPVAPEVEMISQFLPIEELAQVLKEITPATHADNAVFSNLCLRRMNGRLAVIGSDRKLVHVGFLDYPMEVDCRISRASVDSLLKAVHQTSGMVSLRIGTRSLRLTSPDLELSYALVNEVYPDITPLIAEKQPSIISKVHCRREEMIQALKSCALIGGGDIKFVAVKAEKNSIVILATNSTGTEIEAEVEGGATVPVMLICPSLQLAAVLELMGEEIVEILHYPGCIQVRGEARIAFIALADPSALNLKSK